MVDGPGKQVYPVAMKKRGGGDDEPRSVQLLVHEAAPGGGFHVKDGGDEAPDSGLLDNGLGETRAAGGVEDHDGFVVGEGRGEAGEVGLGGGAVG